MIVAAALMAISVFLLIYYTLKLLGPFGPLQKRKIFLKRILDFYRPRRESPEQMNEHIERRSQARRIMFFERILENYAYSQKISRQIKRAGHNLSVSVFLGSCLGFSVLIFLCFRAVSSFLPSLFFAVITAVAPFIYLHYKNKFYLYRFEALFPDALSIISNSIRVGQSIETSINAVAKSNLNPISREFRHLLSEIQLGQPLHVALEDLYESVQLQEVKIFATGVNIHHEFGGNLSEILDTLEKTIRERFSLKREVRALSSQGVMSMWVLLGIPFAVAAIWTAADPELMVTWIKTTPGKIGMFYSVGITIVAFLMMKRMTNIQY